jgi:hypothetical protein
VLVANGVWLNALLVIRISGMRCSDVSTDALAMPTMNGLLFAKSRPHPSPKGMPHVGVGGLAGGGGRNGA